MPHIVEKILMRAIALLLTSSQLEIFRENYEPPKSQESQVWEFRDSHFGVPGRKGHLDVALVKRHRVYYKGEGGGFPPSLGHGESCESKLPVAYLSTKSAPTMH
jgi:hypothetical protein